MKTYTLLLPALLLTTLARLGASEPTASKEFSKKHLTPFFWAEGAGTGDFNHDGKADVVYGPYWWEGPDFTKKHTYADNSKTSKIKTKDGAEETIEGYKGALSNENEYSNNFFAFGHDINGDGWSDILVLGFPGQESTWYENPKGGDGKWTPHVALDVTDNESPHFTDLTGDGQPEIVCNSKGFIGYAEYDAGVPTAPWKWHSISPKGDWQRFTHGLGVGDVNGDGKKDILEKDGWWEQPQSLAGDPVWKKHDAQFGDGGAQMYAYDVNGDGKNDVITSLQAHGYGVVWFEQTDDGGVTGWNKHMIIAKDVADSPIGVAFSQPHAMDLVDMDGDGIKDIITGKRFWAHGPEGDPEPMAAPVLYWIGIKRNGGKVSFEPHLVDQESGVGTQVMAADLNGDGKPDLLVGNKRGAFVFLQK